LAEAKIGTAADDARRATFYLRGVRSTKEVEMTYRVLAAASAVALLAVLVVGCSGGGGAAFTKQTLTFTERQSDDSASFVDNPPRSSAATGDEPKLSPGDQLTFTADMLDRSGTDVGDLDASCAVTATPRGSFDDSHAQCVGTADIAGGSLTLTVGGKAFGAGTTRGAVVGGTGDYAGATGTFESSDESGTDKPSQDTFRLFIPKQ
jgi:hypothetical protein